MPAPLRAELQHALLEIRQAAERLRAYEAALADQLQSVLTRHLPTVATAGGVSAEVRVQLERIAAQGHAVLDCIARTRQYPSQIMARADVLDRTGMLSKMVRDFLARMTPPPR